MIYDPVDRRYEDDTGRPLTPKEVRAHIETYIQSEQSEVEREAELLVEAQKDSSFDDAEKILLITAFFAYLANKIRTWHSVAGVIAYGGEDQMNTERWRRLGAKIDSELVYLQAFEETIRNSRLATEVITTGVTRISTSISPGAVEAAVIDSSPSQVAKVLEKIVADTVNAEAAAKIAGAVPEAVVDSLRWGELPNRAQLYPESLYSTYENSVKEREVDSGASLGRRVCEEDTESCEECVAAASTYFEPLDDIPEIGSLQCLNNCRCYFEYAEPNPNQELLVEIAS